MKPQLKSTSAARNLIKRFEPFRDIAVRADNGRWIVGYGHRAAAKEGARVRQDEADLLLIYDVLQAEQAIEDVVNSPLKPAQRDALVSFVHDIGASAFKRSDVARYLFEGRTMAAGEALAIYGDSRLDRREAESALFMTSFAPPASKKAEERANATVELVIKVEHPGEAPLAPPVEAPVPVLETVEAEADAVPAAPAAEIAPPPSAREIAARREAEDEIARILAVVGEMPIEMRAPDAAPAVEPAPEPELAPEPEPEPEPVPAAVVAPEPSASVEVEPALAAALAEVEAVEAAVAEPEPEMQPEPEADTDALETGAPEAEGVEAEVVEAEVVEAELAPDTTEHDTPEAEAEAETEAEQASFDEPASANTEMPIGEPAARPAPRRRPAMSHNGFVSNIPTVPLDLVQSSEPEEARLPEALDEAVETPVDTARGEAAAAQVVARMSQEIEHVQTDAESPVTGRAAIQTYDETLPQGATLGFALAGQLAAHFPQLDDEPEAEASAADETVEAELAELAQAMADVEDEVAGDRAADGAPEMISLSGLAPKAAAEAVPASEAKAEPAEADAPEADSAEAVAPEADSAEADAQPAAAETSSDNVAEAVTARVHDVVEKVIAAADEDTPPPLPAAAPVDAADGMLGEVEADPSVERAAAHLVDDIADERRDPVIDDDFSPQDLAAGEDVFTGTEPAAAPKDRSTIMFVLSLIAGLVVAGIGGVAAFPSLDQIWGQRQLSMEAWMFIGGTLVFLASAAQLFSIWMEKQQDKAKI